jgi:hypothetical protein
MATITPIPPERRFQDLTGNRYGRLVVLGWAGHSRHGHPVWICRCDCGKEKEATSSNLRGNTRSCGCLNRENQQRLGRADLGGITKFLPEYGGWRQMIRRCHNPSHQQYPRYGGRGITVCDRWRYGENGEHGFLCFIADMGLRPSDRHTLDRTNNDLGYSPENCAWRTFNEQARNRGNTVMVTYRGQEMTLPAACELAGLRYQIVWQRLFLIGMSMDRALSQPARQGNYRRKSNSK